MFKDKASTNSADASTSKAMFQALPVPNLLRKARRPQNLRCMPAPTNGQKG